MLHSFYLPKTAERQTADQLLNLVMKHCSRVIEIREASLPELFKMRQANYTQRLSPQVPV